MSFGWFADCLHCFMYGELMISLEDEAANILSCFRFRSENILEYLAHVFFAHKAITLECQMI